jgi:hypothetical protein
MENYSIYLSTETEKYDFINAARAAGATITGVSGCGTGYYIQIDATREQADYINRTAYTAEIHNYSPTQAWLAWKSGRLTAGQLVTWQQRHGVQFTAAGEVV